MWMCVTVTVRMRICCLVESWSLCVRASIAWKYLLTPLRRCNLTLLLAFTVFLGTIPLFGGCASSLIGGWPQTILRHSSRISSWFTERGAPSLSCDTRTAYHTWQVMYGRYRLIDLSRLDGQQLKPAQFLANWLFAQHWIEWMRSEVIHTVWVSCVSSMFAGAWMHSWTVSGVQHIHV